MGAPPLEDSYDNAKGSVPNLDDVTESGTVENDSFKAKHDFPALALTILQTAGVAVWWAPLHKTGKIPNPDDRFPLATPLVLFNVWRGYENDTSKNIVAEIQASYKSRYTITRDEVLNLK